MDINGLFLNFRFCLSHDEENEFTALGYFQKLLLLLWGGGGGGQRPKRPHTYKKSKKGPRKRGFLGPFDPVFLA